MRWFGFTTTQPARSQADVAQPDRRIHSNTIPSPVSLRHKRGSAICVRKREWTARKGEGAFGMGHRLVGDRSGKRRHSTYTSTSARRGRGARRRRSSSTIATRVCVCTRSATSTIAAERELEPASVEANREHSGTITGFRLRLREHRPARRRPRESLRECQRPRRLRPRGRRPTRSVNSRDTAQEVLAPW